MLATILLVGIIFLVADTLWSVGILMLGHTVWEKHTYSAPSSVPYSNAFPLMTVNNFEQTHG